MAQPEGEPGAPSVAPEVLRGLFVALEGGDGAGKTTQQRLLAEWLVSVGRRVLTTREPGGTPVGRAIRDVVLHGGHVAPRAEALLFAADRAHHVETLVRPALERGVDVLTDRYLDSSVAYQGAGRALGAQEVRRLSVWATGGLLPDLTVVLDIAPERGRRRRGHTPDRLESEPDDFHALVRQHFLDLAARSPDRYLVVDADQPPDRVHAVVRARLGPLLDEPTGSARPAPPMESVPASSETAPASAPALSSESTPAPASSREPR